MFGSGDVSTSSIAFCKCFLPIYPFGHKVSEIISTGITTDDDNLRLSDVATVDLIVEENMLCCRCVYFL